jgi:hypothetical protein
MIHVLWGPGWTRLPSRRAQVLPQRGHGPRPLACAAADAGVRDGDHGPLPRPLESTCLQGKASRVHDSRPLGSGMDPSGSSQQQDVLPQRGHGPRRSAIRRSRRTSPAAERVPLSSLIGARRQPVWLGVTFRTQHGKRRREASSAVVGSNRLNSPARTSPKRQGWHPRAGSWRVGVTPGLNASIGRIIPDFDSASWLKWPSGS